MGFKSTVSVAFAFGLLFTKLKFYLDSFSYKCKYVLTNCGFVQKMSFVLLLFRTLQMDAELTLEKALKMIRQIEAVHEYQLFLKEGESNNESGNLDLLKSRKQQVSKFTSQLSRPNHSKICSRCVKGSHYCDKFPAREAICHRCQKKGHHSEQCHTK